MKTFVKMASKITRRLPSHQVLVISQDQQKTLKMSPSLKKVKENIKVEKKALKAKEKTAKKK